MKLSDSTKNIFKALSQFRTELKQPKKDANNPQFRSKYVPLENVTDVIDQTAPKHGLAYFQNLSNEGADKVGVQTVITHESGEHIIFDWIYLDTRPFIKGGGRGEPTAQSQGSAITYGRRYSLSSAFGIASEVDDDGNGASGQENAQNNSYTPKHANQGKTITEPKESVDNAIKQGYAKIKSISGEFNTNDKINNWIKEKGKYDDLRKVKREEILTWIGKLLKQVAQPPLQQTNTVDWSQVNE